VLLLVVASAGVLQLKANGVPQTAVILSASNAVDGQDALARHFDAGSGSPVVVVSNQANAGEVLETVKATDGVGAAYLLAEGSVPITGAPGRRPARQCATAGCSSTPPSTSPPILTLPRMPWQRCGPA
jgi:RND superfamily putative drug exporter